MMQTTSPIEPERVGKPDPFMLAAHVGFDQRVRTDEIPEQENPPPTSSEVVPLPLIVQLCQELDAGAITYCHWKSNWKLNDWARGKGDLDLLVERSDSQRFMTILSSLGFKQALPPRQKQVPGIQDYYGLDTEANCLVHVHAHYRLVLGHDLTKNYHLPMEEPYLRSSIRRGLFKVPAPEFELVLFVLRMVLKFSVFESFFMHSQSVALKAVQKELKYLEGQVERTKIDALLRLHLPFIDPIFFETCKSSLRLHCPVRRRLSVRQQLRRRLKAHARSSQAVAALLTFERRMLKLTRRLGRVVPGATGWTARKRLVRGGALIALVGGDGAGKTTCLDDLYQWLSKKFDTRRVHLGKPPRSLITWTVLIPLRIRQNFSRLVRGGSPGRSDLSAFPGYLQLLRWVCAARDRYRLYVRARRFASNGGIVICDRYPTSIIKLMDGPNIYRCLDKAPKNRMVQFLLKTETHYYQQIMSPDLLIVLKVDPEIAVRRKVSEKAAHVRTRSRELWEADWRGTQAHVIDVSQPLTDVLKHLRSLIWTEL